MRSMHALPLLAALGLSAAALAQVPSAAPPAPAPPPPPPAAPAPPAAGPRALPSSQFPTPPRMSFYEAPVGRMADYLYASISSHKADLGITDDQMKSIDALHEPSTAQRQTRFMARENARRELQELANADPVDMKAVEAKAAIIASNTTEEMVADLRLREAIRKVLTADQKAKIKNLRPEFPGIPNMPNIPRPPMMNPAVPGQPAQPVPPPPAPKAP